MYWEHFWQRDKLIFFYWKKFTQVKKFNKSHETINWRLLRIAREKLLCGWPTQKRGSLTLHLLHHLRLLWHKCLMRREIFSRGKVISIRVWEWSVCVCWCVHLLCGSVNPQHDLSRVLTDRCLINSASWRRRSHPTSHPTTHCILQKAPVLSAHC